MIHRRSFVPPLLSAPGLLALLLTALDIDRSTMADDAPDPSARQRPGPPDLVAKPAVHEVSIELAEDAIRSLGNAPRKHVHSTVTIDGRRYHDVEIHLKGSVGSFRTLEDKPGLTLSFASSKASTRFYQLKKFHLNNSVQDPSYLSELISTELFRTAGVPAPHVGHAWVKLNNRSLGLYTLEESYDQSFLAAYFKNTHGNLYGQPEAGDVTDPLGRVQGTGPNTHADLKALAAATLEPDPGRRWERLQGVLDIDRFISFMAMEILLCHWDGYTFGRHNYRVYQDLDTGRAVFFPHDLDQVMGDPSIPILPDVNGLVSQAILGTPEGRTRYRERFGTLFTNVFKASAISRRIDSLVAQLTPAIKAHDPNLAGELESAAASLKERAMERQRVIQRLLQKPEPKPLQFDNGLASLAGWQARSDQGGVEMVEVTDGGHHLLHIKCTGAGGVASWRTAVLLEAGTYRFSGRAQAKGLSPRADGPGAGGGLRISGQQRQNSVSGDSGWVDLTHQFTVDGGMREVVLVCELRAQAGEIWFDAQSLQLKRLP